MDMDDGARQSAVVSDDGDTAAVARARTGGPSSSTARWGRCSKFLLVWSLAESVSIAVYVFAGRLWGFVVAGAILALGLVFTCYYINIVPPAAAASPHQPWRQQQVGGAAGCLSQEDIEAIPAFEYRRRRREGEGEEEEEEEEEEECAVCIGAVRDGETVRRLPACGHAFHARCINGWLRAHATCPVCRAGVNKVAGETTSAGQVEAAV
ncbi:hypothetical protein U9M48_037263 [Paspalum notatum var. saurae]|uniref:RING-type E3 ubiquitin transferase n=1 Tax=Paspalum notatum var. saurae TaxID=547442 RepID=A0AAQ3XAF4_PASNO